MYQPEAKISEILFWSNAVVSDVANTMEITDHHSPLKESCLPCLLVLTWFSAISWTFTSITPVTRQSKPTHCASRLILPYIVCETYIHFYYTMDCKIITECIIQL